MSDVAPASGIQPASGIHDMGGTQGWGRVPVPEPDEPVFHERWEARAFAIALLSMRTSGTNLDAFRHALSRLNRHEYLDDGGYYGRWLHGAENLLHDSSIIARGAVEARAANLAGAARGEPPVPEPEAPAPNKPNYAPTAAGSIRKIDAEPAFEVGQSVRARSFQPPGHTRLPRYVMGHAGSIAAIRPAQVYPDTHAHFLGENAQWVYNVRFDSTELFGPDAERFDLNIDLYEDYLEAA